jgi:DNA-binding winged helix-turn-helix (wHTH) protein/pimeloyl-ACP methyl ester carboxylesterase
LPFHCGDFVLDPERRELRSGGRAVPVEPQVFDLLEFLIRNRNRVVSRDDLLAGVWGGRIVSDSAIAARINAARQAIGDDGREQRFIRTIARKGFRFIGEVREEGERDAAGLPPGWQAPRATRDQRITFCRTPDGVNLAVARVGRGTPLVCVPSWGSHLEYDWENPTRAQLLHFLADRFELIRYDGRGFGLSDRNVGNVSLATFQSDLETVADALDLRRYAVFGASVGSSTAIAHSASRPDCVSKLLIHEGLAQGASRRTHVPIAGLVNAYVSTMGQTWDGVLHFVRMRVSETYPGLSAEQIRWIVELMPKTTSLENALSHFSAYADIDVVDRLPMVSAPTLVLHCRHCHSVPLEQALRIAASIPNARLVNLDSANAVPLPGEPAWPAFLAAIESFLTEP